MRIALDVMGGDLAPQAILRGAVRAVQSGYVSAEDIILVGDEVRIRQESERQPVLASMEIADYPEVVEMHENAIEALRKKRRASILGCIELVGNGTAQALVSAGHTGATVGGATVHLRLLKGIRRAGLAVTYQGASGTAILIDVGANITCKPIHLFQYGLMGAWFCKDVLAVTNPRVGLLNIGAEDRKGTNVVKKTHDLYRESGLNFVGNLEGQDLFRGVADVIVTDGFVGNIVLKVSEGLTEYLLASVNEKVNRLAQSSGEQDLKPVLEGVLASVRDVGSGTDYTEHGGALLLGVDGIVVIGHGRSEEKAIASALRQANRFARAQVNRHIVAGLERSAEGVT